MKAYRTTSDLPLNRRAKAVAGNLLRVLRPRLAAQVDERPFDPDWDPVARLIRNAHLYNAVHRRDHETLRRYFTHYWASSSADEFFDGYAYRFEELFLRHHAGIADRIAAALPLFHGQRARLVEVGSGDGRVLAWLAERLKGVSEFHGVDLNAAQIARCRETHPTSDRLIFHEGHLLEWLRAHPAPNTILVTNGGVFEYLLEDELRSLFVELRLLCSPCLVAITETIATDHDLATETASLPYGHELAFSHNYPALLREAGFEISWEHDRRTLPGEENHPARWMQLVATANEPSSISSNTLLD